jgi:hypothetical protein
MIRFYLALFALPVAIIVAAVLLARLLGKKSS